MKTFCRQGAELGASHDVREKCVIEQIIFFTFQYNTFYLHDMVMIRLNGPVRLMQQLEPGFKVEISFEGGTTRISITTFIIINIYQRLGRYNNKQGTDICG